MSIKEIDVTSRFLDFGHLLIPYNKFYEGFGDYNFRHYAEEIFEKVLLITVYNDVNWEFNQDSFSPIEFDDSTFKKVKNLGFNIYNINSNALVFSGKITWFYFQEQYFIDYNFENISYELRNEIESTAFGFSHNLIATTYKIYAYFVD